MTKISSDRRWVPYEHRPVLRFVDVAVLQRRGDEPNSYYVDDSKIVLIHDDEVAEYEFTDPSRRSEQIVLLEASSIRRVNLTKGWIRLAAILAGFVILLQIVVWIAS